MTQHEEMTPMTSHDVVIAGGGPTGLVLAAELTLAGIDAAIVERRASQQLDGPRARGIHARTIEMLDQRGVADRLLALGQRHSTATFLDCPLDLRTLPTRHNFLLALGQQEIENVLAEWVGDLGTRTYREREVTGFVQDEGEIRVRISDGTTVRAKYLVGCDGGRSLVRKAAGIPFPGHDATTSWLMAEADFRQEPKWGFHTDALGRHAIGKLRDGTRAGMVLVEKELRTGDKPDVQDVRDALVAVYGTDFGIHSPTWMSRFTDAARQAATYRSGRVLLAGDAAHVHAPIGGQGLSLGIGDAVNLGWKLAQVVSGTSPVALLDTYQTERHPVAARLLRNTMADVAFRRQDDRAHALRSVISELLMGEEARRRCAEEVSGLAARYDHGHSHPLVGRRMPDLDLHTAEGELRVFSLLHTARPLLLVFGAHEAIDIARWSGVRRVDASHAGPWVLPGIGPVSAPDVVLVRPDGHVAWAGSARDHGLEDALAAWFGAPIKASRFRE